MVSPVSSPLSGESPWVDWHPHSILLCPRVNRIPACSDLCRNCSALPLSVGSLPRGLTCLCGLPCPCRRLRRGKPD